MIVFDIKKRSIAVVVIAAVGVMIIFVDARDRKGKSKEEKEELKFFFKEKKIQRRLKQEIVLYATYLDVLYFSFVRLFSFPLTTNNFECKGETTMSTTKMCYLKFKKRATKCYKRIISSSYAINRSSS